MKEIIYTLPPLGDQDQERGYLAAAWILVMTAVLTTIIRILVRARLTRNLGWDDFWIVVCMVSNLVGLGFVTKEVTDGGSTYVLPYGGPAATLRDNWVA